MSSEIARHKIYHADIKFRRTRFNYLSVVLCERCADLWRNDIAVVQLVETSLRIPSPEIVCEDCFAKPEVNK